MGARFTADEEASKAEYFYVKNGEEYSCIEKGAKGNDTYTITKDRYDSVISNEYRNMLDDYTYDSFSYNEATKSYKSDDGKMTVAFTFNDGKLTKIEAESIYDGSDGGEPMTTNYVITFDNVTINLPTDSVE